MKVANNDFFKLLEEEIKERDVTFKVKGTSMKPFFKDLKTNVTLTKTNIYKKYDCILFKYGQNYVLHRIVKIVGNKFITEGDNLLAREVVLKEDVIGKVIAYENYRVIYTNNFFYQLRVFLWYQIKTLKRGIKWILRRK